MAKWTTPDRQTPAGMKWCPRCSEVKKLADFGTTLVTRKAAFGALRVPNTICLACAAVASKRYRDKHRKT